MNALTRRELLLHPPASSIPQRGDEQVYLGSADAHALNQLRTLDSEDFHEEATSTYQADEVKARHIQSGGSTKQ